MWHTWTVAGQGFQVIHEARPGSLLCGDPDCLPDGLSLGRMTVPEKILLLEDLWDRIAAEPSSVPVPKSHREELDRRLAGYEKDPGQLLTLEDLRGRVEARR